MASTFQRRSSRAALLPGTKAWTAGTALVSTGVRELDTILTTAGQPLGTCLYLQDDRLSLGSTLMHYWCAEALSQEQELLIPITPDCVHCRREYERSGSMTHEESMEESSRTRTTTAEDVLAYIVEGLPRNLHRDKQDTKTVDAASASHSTTTNPLGTLMEDDDDDVDDSEEGLVVAWQYRKEVQQKRLGGMALSKGKLNSSGPVFCHSYDLQGKLTDQIHCNPSVSPIGLCPCSNLYDARDGAYEYFNALVQKVERMGRNKVIRLLLYHPNVKLAAVALPLFLNHVRRKKLPVVVFVAISPETTASPSLRELQNCSDIVLESDSFAARRNFPPPAEFRHLHGLLKIRKACTCTLATSVGHFAHVTTQKRPAANVYGLKRDQRKLHICLLHIPPEDYADAGGSVGGGGVRSGAGRPTEQRQSATSGCASSGGGGGKSPLDF